MRKEGYSAITVNLNPQEDELQKSFSKNSGLEQLTSIQ
jgi:hypothetical protein